MGELVAGTAARAAVGALAGLPPDVVASLRAAFAEEVSVRLPVLRSAARGELADATPSLVEEALRNAHTLGSSAAVVGEAELSRAAREVEALLAAGDLESVTGPAGRLVGLLEGWTA